MPYIGKTPSKVPLTSDDIADGTVSNADLAGSITSAKITSLDATKLTGTVNNARISLDAAEIPNLDTAKVTSGTFADARISEASVTQHVTATDLTPVKNDISLLALQNAINGNLSAYGLKNSWIEQFENSTYIENLTDTARDTETEYMSAGTASTTTLADGTIADTITSFGSTNNPSWSSTAVPAAFYTPNSVGNQTNYWSSPSTGYATGFYVDYLASYKWVSLKLAKATSYGDVRTMRLRSSTNGSDWTTIDQTGTVASVYSGISSGYDNNITGFDSTGVMTMANAPNNKTAGSNLTFGTPVTARYLRMEIGTWGANSNSNVGWQSFIPTYSTFVQSATGSFESTDVVPQDTTNKSSVGLVMLYKDQAGTNTLNTDIIAKVRANTGQVYQTLVLAGAGTYSDGLKIAIAPAIAVTAGQALSYQISFANQSGAKEGRIHGIAMTY
jgi:hypothetical protein